MKILYKKYTVYLIFIFLLSGCANTNTTSEKQTVKVVEAQSSTNSSTIENKSNISPTDIPLNYNNYKVSLDINTETRGVNGVEKITYKNTTGIDLEEIYFHLYLNAFSSVSQKTPYFSEFEDKIFKYGYDTGTIYINSVNINNENVTFDTNNTILKVNLPQTLKTNEKTEITIQFTSYIPKIAHRTGANDKAMWFGNFIPILCKYDSSGWRTDPYYPAGDPFYSDISNYEVKITTPKEYEVVGTGVEVTNEINDKKVTTLTAEMVRDFAFSMSKNYSLKTIKTQSGIDINFYYYSDDIYNIDKMLMLSEKTIKYYSDKLGSYPYTELDIVETELFLNGGMEYPAIVMMDSSYMEKSSSINALVHEIGHQWFYNIIGNDQINEAWLDEGLDLYLQEGVLYSQDEIDERMSIQHNTLQAKLKDITKNNLDTSISQYNNWNSYYNIQYIRSKLMIHSLHKKMGDEMFDTFLKTYYKNYAFKTVTTEEFISTAEDVYGGNLDNFFYRWMRADTIPILEIGGN